MVEEAPQASKNYLFIINPTAGSGLSYEKRQEVLEIARSLPSSDVKDTKYPSHATEIAADAIRDGVDTLFVVGGDGTTNEVLQMTANTPIEIGTIPTGFFNVFAREVGIPKDIPRAGKVLLEGKVKDIDVGEINDTYFLLAADFGMDAEKYMKFHAPGTARRNSGATTFAKTFAWCAITGLGYTGHRLNITNGDKNIDENVLIGAITNTTNYGVLPLNESTVLDDGKLELTYFTGQWAPQIFPQFAGVAMKRDQIPWLKRDTLSGSLTIHTELNDEVGITVDGNPLGKFNTLKASVHPSAQKMLVPQSAPSRLFQLSEIPLQKQF
jgi:diacylglycerol kinase family enzyme